jgi:hypothetical protein
MNRHKSMFPITTNDGLDIKTSGGATMYEEFIVRLMCSHLENPNTNIASIDVRQVIDLANRMFDEIEKK